MTDLDDLIRRGLDSATAAVPELSPDELARSLRAASARDGGPRSGDRRTDHRLLLVAAMLLLLAAVGGAAALVLRDDGTDELTADRGRPREAEGFAGWGTGWHELDTGPIPVGEPPSLAWFDGRLYAAAPIGSAQDSPPTDATSFWSYDPVARIWSELPSPGLVDVDIVPTDSGILAVGSTVAGAEPSIDHPVGWATWSPGDAEWTPRHRVPVADALRQAGTTGPREPTGRRSLLWTGEAVLDLTDGAVLDPADGTASQLEMPESLVAYSHLVGATPVWTGTHAIALSWSTLPGLLWDARGRLAGEVPGPPMAVPGNADPATATVVEGALLLVALEEDHPAALLDLTTGTWQELPAVPGAGEWCGLQFVTVRDEAVVRACDEDSPASAKPYVLEQGAWTSLPPPPRAEQGIERWLGAGDAIVVWSGDRDTSNNPEAPYHWAAVWAPS